MAQIPTTHNGHEIATHEMRVIAANLVLETLRALGHADLIDHLTVDWKTSFTARMGDACYVNVAKRPVYYRIPKKIAANVIDGICARIRFSSILWPRATEAERRNTVIHEVCHIVANHEAALADRAKPQSHGWEWKAVMRRAGVTPKRCHNVNNKDLRKSRRTEVAHCSCREHAITKNMAAKIHRGTIYTCPHCRNQVKLGPKPVTVTPAVIQGFSIPSPAAMGF